MPSAHADKGIRWPRRTRRSRISAGNKFSHFAIPKRRSVKTPAFLLLDDIIRQVLRAWPGSERLTRNLFQNLIASERLPRIFRVPFFGGMQTKGQAFLTSGQNKAK